MADDINALADEYFEFLSRVGPTGAHMRGDYRYMDRFEDLSREAEDDEIAVRRSFVARAAAVDPSSLHGDDVTTREALIFDAETAADLAETRQAEFGVDPTAGLQAMLPVARAAADGRYAGARRSHGRQVSGNRHRLRSTHRPIPRGHRRRENPCRIRHQQDDRPARRDARRLGRR